LTRPGTVKKPASVYYIGLMSGTSMDAIDGVLVDLEQSPPRVLQSHSLHLPATLQQRLWQLGHETPLSDILDLDVQIGELFATAALDLLEQSGIEKRQVAAIGSHGQTIWHSPGQPHTTLQIGDPNRVAYLTGITTVADFRRMDMAAGGQGAPLAPAFHAAVFQSSTENRVILNLGGIANITILPADPKQPVLGFDTGPANTLLDAWSRRHLHQPYDDSGAWAAGGRVDTALLQRLLADDYFRQSVPKSTGPEYFNLDWLQRHFEEKASTPADVQATLIRLTVDSIAEAISVHAQNTGSVRVCGGGINNSLLMSSLTDALSPVPVDSTASLGVAAQWVEATCFAWLARERLAGRAGNLPAVTGASTSVPLGGIYSSQPE
jgi:anhydro-N-acetylmuramic acid kinase